MGDTDEMKMEQMSVAYLTALCAYNGFGLTKETPDTDGVDCIIKCKGKPSPNSLYSPRLDVQLKSSHSRIKRRNKDNALTFPLEAKNYNILVQQPRANPIILVVLHMYKDKNRWLEQTDDYLKITKCAYWVSLKGQKATKNKNYKTIVLPDDHILTKESLRELLIKVSKEEQL